MLGGALALTDPAFANPMGPLAAVTQMIEHAWLVDLLPAVPESWTAYAAPLQYLPIVVFAVAAAWLIRNRIPHWRRMSPSGAELDAFPGEIVSDITLSVTSAPLETLEPAEPDDDCHPDFAPVPVSKPPGADLAARALFVAMSFPGPVGAPLHIPPPRLASASLRIDCHPIRLTLTLRHAALRYRLQLGNRGAEALGPIIIRADLATAEPGIPQDHQAAFDPYALPLRHYLDSLPAGTNAELTGELRLPLASIAAIRLGSAKLLVPLMRVWVETAGAALPALSCARCFAIGIPPAAAGSGIQPFHLDSSLGIWRKLTTRRLQNADLPQP